MKNIITLIFIMLIVGCNDDDKKRERYRQEFHEASVKMHNAGDKAMYFAHKLQMDSAYYYYGQVEAYGKMEDEIYDKIKALK